MFVKKFNYCLDKIRNGDNSGLEDIYIEYYERMTFAALTRIKDYEAAKDIASDFINYILENAKEIAYVDNPSAWVYTCIRNQTVNYIVRERKTMSIGDCDEDTFAKDNTLDPFFILWDIFKLLSERGKDLVELHYIFGFNYAEISKMRNIPVGTIKREVHEIKEKIKHLKKR